MRNGVDSIAGSGPETGRCIMGEAIDEIKALAARAGQWRVQ